MNTFRRLSIFLIGLFLASSLWADWKVGDTVPDLSQYGITGTIPKLEGKVTYVDFWASWCPPCKAAFPAMDRLYSEHKDDGFQILAISLDSTHRAMDQFVARARPSFAIVWDGEQALASDAGIEAMPTSFLVDSKGVIRKMHRGWGGSASEKALEAEILELLESGE